MKTPFTTEEFFEVIAQYNVSLFPGQLLILLFGIAALFLLHTNKTAKNKLIAGFLGILWIWIGIFYHIVYFTSINPAAFGFGVLFILQGIFFFIEIYRNKLEFSFKTDIWAYIGYFFVLFGIIIYPVISYLLENSFQNTISLGLPCPSTILTFGFLMLSGPKLSRYLLIIPTIWAIIGTGAALNFGVYHDFVMLGAAIIADFYLLRRNRKYRKNVQLQHSKS